MNEAAHVVGIDVAKLKLDVALLHARKIKNKVVENNPSGFAQLILECRVKSCNHAHVLRSGSHKAKP